MKSVRWNVDNEQAARRYQVRMGLNIQQSTVDEEESDSLALSEFVY